MNRKLQRKDEAQTMWAALAAARAALTDAVVEIDLLKRRLSTAADKQILLLNEIIRYKDAIHLNSASNLPPVDCTLLIEVSQDQLVQAVRPSHVERRGNEMAYILTDGSTIHGQFRWTYP
jgi:hypothetical protein